MKETKFIEVNPKAVNSTIETWACFGWELMGQPQEIFSQATHRTQETDKHYSSEYTTTTNYVKITFQRDTSLPNYAKLVELEKTYNISSPVSPVSPALFGCLWIVLILIGLIAFIIPGVILLVWRIVRYVKLKKIYEQEFSAYMEKKKIWEQNREKARNEAKSLC